MKGRGGGVWVCVDGGRGNGWVDVKGLELCGGVWRGMVGWKSGGVVV